MAVILLAPLCLTVLARLGRRAPIAVRLALRDLARYRARSGSALAAISLGVLIAVLVCVLSAQRFGNVLDYAGPNLASNQVIVYTPNGPGGGGGPGAPAAASTPQSMAQSAQAIAAGARLPRRRPLEADQRHSPARRIRAAVGRAGLRRHPAAPAGLRDQGF